MLIGYVRASATQQSEAAQIDMLAQAGCERFFIDHAMSAKSQRPQLEHMLAVIGEDDTLMVCKLDRLGRSVLNLANIVNSLKARGVRFKSLAENMDTGAPDGVLIFRILNEMAQFERDLIQERTLVGLQTAKAAGKTGGRAPKLNVRERMNIRELYREHTLTVQEIADKYQVSRKTIYSALKQ